MQLLDYEMKVVKKCPPSTYGNNIKWIKYVDLNTCAPVVSKVLAYDPNTKSREPVYTLHVSGSQGLNINQSASSNTTIVMKGQTVNGAVNITGTKLVLLI